MRTPLRVLFVIVAVILAGGVGIALLLRPPAPLEVPEQGTTLSGVILVNPGIHRTPDRRVVVRDGAIEAITDDPEPGGPYAGSYVLPGLIDMHVHFPPPAGLGSTELFSLLFLYHGVTTVRDAGDIDGTSTGPARKGVENGEFPGPRILSCGPFVDGEGAPWPNSRVVRDIYEAEPVVAEIAREYDCVKAYDRLTPEVARAVQLEARRHGLRVIGHVPRGLRFEDAPLDDVQHMMGMAFAEGDEGPFPKSMKAWQKVDEARMREIVKAALARGTAITPTLVSLERLSRMDDRDSLLREPDALLLPRYFRDVVWTPPADLTPEDYAGIRDALKKEKQLVKLLYEEGTRLHMGTDVLTAFVVPGASMHRELALYVDAGLTPEQAWAVATRWNGSYLGVSGLGRIRVGGPADLLVFRDDPTADLAALSTLQAVVARGRLYTREALDAQLARYRSYYEGFLLDAISVAAARRVLSRVTNDPEHGS
jgi:imidazolonepropionase-like amidohydrolase